MERLLLGFGLPFGGLVAGFLSGVVAMAVGAPEPGQTIVAVVGMIAGIVAASRMAPRVVPRASAFSVSRRVVAGVAGVVGLAVAGRVATWLGLDADALSHSPSYWAILEEVAAMALTFGAMVVATSTALGRPKAVNETAGS